MTIRVSAISPVKTATLQPTYTDFTLPTGGIAAPQDMSSVTFSDDLAAYFVQRVEKQNFTSSDAFTPTLTCIQKFIQTLNIVN